MITTGLVCPNCLPDAEQLKKEHDQFQVAIEVGQKPWQPLCSRKYSGPYILRPLVQSGKYGLKLKVISKWKDIYIKNI